MNQHSRVGNASQPTDNPQIAQMNADFQKRMKGKFRKKCTKRVIASEAKQSKKHRISWGYLFLGFLMGFFLVAGNISIAQAQDSKKVIAAMISPDGYVKDQLIAAFLDGPAFFSNPSFPGWKPLLKGQRMISGDSVKTGNHSHVVIAYSTDNLLLIKPKSQVRFDLQEGRNPIVIAHCQDATVMLATRGADGMHVMGRRGTLSLRRGEATLQTNSQHDLLCALHETASFLLTGNVEPARIPEGNSFEINAQGVGLGLKAIDTRVEYEGYRRFDTWLKNFDSVNRKVSIEMSYAVDSVLINGTYLSHLDVDRGGLRTLDPGSGAVPKTLHIRLKITHYPRVSDRFELYLNKDLVYPLREVGDGFYEAKIPTPSFPEIHAKIHYVDSLGRRDAIFEFRLMLSNKRQRTEEIKAFLQEFSRALARRDVNYLRAHIDRDYRDLFGNSFYDFSKLLDDTIRQYRDIRLLLRPHTYQFRDGSVQVNLNYRFSALTGNWNSRYEDMGVDLWTLVCRDKQWMIHSKTRGMLLQRMKVVIDPRRGVLKGRVLDEASGAPIQGATIRLLNTRFQTVSDRFGEYIIYNIQPGKFDIEIAKNGYGKTTLTRVEIVPATERF